MIPGCFCSEDLSRLTAVSTIPWSRSAPASRNTFLADSRYVSGSSAYSARVVSRLGIARSELLHQLRSQVTPCASGLLGGQG